MTHIEKEPNLPGWLHARLAEPTPEWIWETSRFLRTQASFPFVTNFGHQWNTFRVEDEAEDERTFVAKTGVELSALSGMTVLDAGCGGGRYSLVAARHGANVIAVDLSESVRTAAHLLADFPNAYVIQADLAHLPLRNGVFDLVFSLGVLHHAPDPPGVFHKIAATTRLGGRLSIWVYRRNTRLQEAINDAIRKRTAGKPPEKLMHYCRFGASLGGIPLLGRVLNKLVPFSTHPRWETRVCDTFDWYAPVYQSHHDESEVLEWFREANFQEIHLLPPERNGKLYRWCWKHGLLIGSGVNATGIAFPDRPERMDPNATSRDGEIGASGT